MSLYLCRDFGDISKWLPPSRITKTISALASKREVEDNEDTFIPSGGVMNLTLNSLTNAFAEIDSVLSGDCTIYYSADHITKCPLSETDLKILNQLKQSENVNVLICLKIMQAVYKNEAGSQGNLPGNSNYVERGNGVIITKASQLGRATGLYVDGLYYYALYTAPFGKAYGVNPDVLIKEIGPTEITESVSQAISLAKESSKHVLLKLTNKEQVDKLRQSCSSILEGDKYALTSDKSNIYGYSSLRWMTYYYMRSLNSIDKEKFDTFMSKHSMDNEKTLFCLYFLLDCIYNLPASKDIILNVDFSNDSLNLLSNKLVIPNRKEGESQSAYNRRCQNVAQAWINTLSNKPGFQTVAQESLKNKRWTFIQNLSSRYNTLIRRISNG